MALLSLFAVVGLSFVFYADAEAVAAQNNREAQLKAQPDVDPELAAAYFLNQLLYPSDNVYSAMQGHDLARSIFGFNPNALNFTPYNGIGRQSYAPAGVNDPDLGVPYANLINHGAFWDPNPPGAPNNKTVNFVRPPEYYGKAVMITPTGATSAGTTVTITTAYAHGFAPGNQVVIAGVLDTRYNSVNGTSFTITAVSSAPAPPSFSFTHPTNSNMAPSGYGYVAPFGAFRYVGGANPPWTAYDTNNMCLAQVGADGTVYMPSFQRPWLEAYLSSLPAAQQAAVAKYLRLRPDVSWHPRFVTPDSDTPLGPDVKNLEFGPGMARPGGGYYNNDSIWMDIGAPIMTAPNGKRYKMLVAPLIMDLSNRLHLWAHGNRIGANGTSVSNRGYGAPEVNLSLLPNMQAAEWKNLLDIRYGGAGALPAGSPTALKAGPFYAPHDFDGRDPINGLSSKQLTSFETKSTALTNQGTVAMPVQALSGVTAGGFPWAIYVGMQLSIDVVPNPDFEVVTVTAINPAAVPPTFTANFARQHNPNTSVAPFSTYFPFPSYPTGWDNSAAAEVTQKPLGINFFNLPGLTPQGPASVSHMEALLRYGGTNAPATTSSIFQRMPTTFNNARSRNMVTLASWHLDRISASPVISWDGTTSGHYRLVPPPPGQAPQPPYPQLVPPGPIVPNPNVPATFPAANNSEFTADWRSNLGAVLRVNLNRILTDYPAQNPLTGVIDSMAGSASMAQYNQAVLDRQNFARDIYSALIRVTGAQDPNAAPPASVAAGPADYNAARWLAQLAVNIVDYIDNDDYSTPFNWNAQAVTNFAAANPPLPPLTPEFVFGTELPRLVINEVYGQRDNRDNNGNGNGNGNPPPWAPANGQGNRTQGINLWVELHNPFASTPAGSSYPRDGGVAKLYNTNGAVYQVVFCPNTNANPNLSAKLREPSNNLGDLDTASRDLAATMSDWVATTPNPVLTEQVLPANGAAAGPQQGNRGFYVVGPNAMGNNIRQSNPPLLTTHSSDSMSLRLNNPIDAPSVTVLLRRLACPHLPPNPPPTPLGAPLNPNLPYNPYITVDYLEKVPIADYRERDNNGNGNPQNSPQDAFGRRHPYSAYHVPPPGNVALSQVRAQTGGTGNQPGNTFFSQNNPNDAPYAWLTHLDRPLVNQLELLHVSGFKPHELTQQFIVNGAKFQHYAPWTSDPSSGIFRALDVLGTPNKMLGTKRGGRWPGLINLNTLMSDAPEISQALADSQDAQPYFGFSQAEVNNIHAKIIQSRHNAPGTNTPPNSDGKPFKSFAAGDLSDTLLRFDSAGLPVFSVGAVANPPYSTHPYQRWSLLQKIFNNTTTTSNVFAVWFTVGYFEVVDESVRPARLGAEIGRDQNVHIRHRFFAIVDRSGLQLINTTSASAAPVNPAWNNATNYAVGNIVNFNNGLMYRCIQANNNTPPPNAAYWVRINQTATMTYNGLTGTAGNAPLIIQPGMLLEIDTGLNSEVVAVQSATPGPVYTFTAEFTRSHAAGAPIICRGNPGPRQNYNPRRDTGVVLHMSVIQ
jgi:hypothetical protein